MPGGNLCFERFLVDLWDGDVVGPALYEGCAFVQGLSGDLLMDEQVDDERSGAGAVVVAGGAEDDGDGAAGGGPVGVVPAVGDVGGQEALLPAAREQGRSSASRTSTGRLPCRSWFTG